MSVIVLFDELNGIDNEVERNVMIKDSMVPLVAVVSEENKEIQTRTKKCRRAFSSTPQRQNAYAAEVPPPSDIDDSF